MKIANHITHEAVQKIGGIGSVITGLCTSDNYKSYYDNTLLYGPLFNFNDNVYTRLGKGGEVLFSNHDNLDKGNFNNKFYSIIQKYNISIVYGKRTLVDEFNINKKNEVDVILIDVTTMNTKEIDKGKFILWEKFGIQSDKYKEWDYEQYLRIGICFPEIIQALYGNNNDFHHFSHEYMGMASCLFSKNKNPEQKAYFYAHEISPARMITEKISGHDTSFYNLMEIDKKQNISFEQRFGNLDYHYRSALVKKTSYLDGVLAVSDLTKKEYLYLNPHINPKKVKTVYNGIPLKYVSPEEKQKSRQNLQDYFEILFNYRPDFIFTHVSRLVLSKAIWRDISLLNYLDKIFHKNGIKACYLLLATQIGTGRPTSEIYKMENDYGWPILHKKEWPDLVGMEQSIYEQISVFNARSKNIKALFVNQFGFDKRKCGNRVPEYLSFKDLRVGSDIELGMSIYEPFGIAQLETIPFGGKALVSTSCGNASLLKEAFANQKNKPYILANFIDTFNNKSIHNLENLDIHQRTAYENKVLEELAQNIFENLDFSNQDRNKALDQVQEHMNNISWEAIVNRIDLKSL